MRSLTELVRERVREGADRLVARALGQQWQPVRPTPPRERTRAAAPTRSPRDRAEPLDVEVEVPVPGSALLDIREPGELAQGVAEGAMCVPMDAVPHVLAELRALGPITVYCAAGARSFGVAHYLREHGIEAWSLAGGIGAVRVEGVRIVVPEPRPGTRVRLPADTVVDGVVLGAPVEAEVVGPGGLGGPPSGPDARRTRVVFRDAAGFVGMTEV